MVERITCPCEPMGCVVWSLGLLVGSPMAKWSQVRGQTKNGSQRLHERTGEKEIGGGTLPGGSLGPPSGARPRRWARRWATDPRPGTENLKKQHGNENLDADVFQINIRNSSMTLPAFAAILTRNKIGGSSGI